MEALKLTGGTLAEAALATPTAAMQKVFMKILRAAAVARQGKRWTCRSNTMHRSSQIERTSRVE